jgi:16S rRNA (guanine(527)-N(7))-methyltransferase RsmG
MAGSGMNEQELAERISTAFTKAAIEEPTPEITERLLKFAREVALRGARMHLVGKSRIEENIGLLILDSLLILKIAETQGIVPIDGGTDTAHGRRSICRVADIGSGAGFPGVVWKVLRPHLDVTLFERKARTHAFLERIIAHLQLGGAKAVGDDAARPAYRGSFDVAVSKAAGRLSSLLPLAEGLLSPGGTYLTIKGDLWREEVGTAKASSMRGGRAVRLAEGRGHVLIFRKA